MLSMKAKYGLKAMLTLAERHAVGPMLIADLSSRERLPRKFLENILLQLKRAGILASKKGRGGGYRLGRPPEEITLGEVVRLLDGPLALVPCASLTAYRKCGDCADEVTCGVRIIMKEVRDATAGILDGTTLTDLLQRQRSTGDAGGAAPDWEI
jgi:Rrf2 family protein